tara:strand:+ start:596 stop:874 length:279 start_codon:yes stop_codon:yes gene_type:complete
MALHTIEISSEDDLSARWTDGNLPIASFKFNEEKLEECPLLDNGKYRATYNTREYATDTTIKYILNDADEIAANGSGTKTIVIPAGEYGIKS